jgi:hypothetical protein
VNRFLSIVATSVVGVALVACGPAASDGSGEPSSDASQAAASEAQSSGGGVLPSFKEGAVADLEALIPDTVGGVSIQKLSMAGAEFLSSADSGPTFIKFVEDLGVSPTDISIAYGFSSLTAASAPPGRLFMFVMRASGADTGHLMSVFKTSADTDRDTPLTWTTEIVGGKTVQKADDGVATNYLYAWDDILTFVIGDPDLVAETFSGLP